MKSSETRQQTFEKQQKFNSIDFTKIDPEQDKKFHNEFRDRLEAIFLEVHFIYEDQASQFFWIGQLKPDPVLGQDYLILRRNMELLDNPIMGEKDPARYWLLVPSDCGRQSVGSLFLQRPMNREKYRGNYFIFINLFSVLKCYVRRNFPWLMKDLNEKEREEIRRQFRESHKHPVPDNDMPRDQDTSDVTQYCTPQERMIRLSQESKEVNSINQNFLEQKPALQTEPTSPLPPNYVINEQKNSFISELEIIAVLRKQLSEIQNKLDDLEKIIQNKQ